MAEEAIQHFDDAAATWDEKPSRRERIEKTCAAIRKHAGLTPTMRVLDYGGATGLLARLLAPHVAKVIVADASRGMIDVLETRIGEAGLTNVEALHMPQPLGEAALPEADLVVTCMTLHHVKDTDPALAAFAQCLTPGGTLVIVDLEKEDGSFHGDRSVPHNGFEPGDLTRRVEAVGFHNVKTETIDSMDRETDSGLRAFPIFLMTGQRDA